MDTYSIPAGQTFVLGKLAPASNDIKIVGPDGRVMVHLTYIDGRMTATYDPADLDEAAQCFWEGVAVWARAVGAPAPLAR